MLQIRDQKAKEFNLDLDRLAVGGISAGGHLSAVMAHMARDAAIPLALHALQVLSIPCTDLDHFSPTGVREISYRTAVKSR